MRTLNDDIMWLYRLLARREKQLKRNIFNGKHWHDEYLDLLQLYKEVQTIVYFNHWHKRSLEGDPLKSGRYLARSNSEWIGEVIFNGGYAYPDGKMIESPITHWRELPPPPEEI